MEEIFADYKLVDWPIGQLGQKTTSAIFRNPATGEWTPGRAELHEEIIHRLLARKQSKKEPEIWVLAGGVGSGKFEIELIGVGPGEHPGAVVIDAATLVRSAAQGAP